MSYKLMYNIFPFDTCETVNKNGIAQPLIYYFYSQIVVFGLLYLFYLKKIPKLQNNFKLLFFLILIISLLALNEKKIL